MEEMFVRHGQVRDRDVSGRAVISCVNQRLRVRHGTQLRKHKTFTVVTASVETKRGCWEDQVSSLSLSPLLRIRPFANNPSGDNAVVIHHNPAPRHREQDGREQSQTLNP